MELLQQHQEDTLAHMYQVKLVLNILLAQPVILLLKLQNMEQLQHLTQLKHQVMALVLQEVIQLAQQVDTLQELQEDILLEAVVIQELEQELEQLPTLLHISQQQLLPQQEAILLPLPLRWKLIIVEEIIMVIITKVELNSVIQLFNKNGTHKQ